MTQQLVLKPNGIISQPNKLGTIPQGALQFADQCYMRQPGMIENANTYSIVSPSLGGLASDPGFVTPVDNQFVLLTYKNGGVAKTAFVDTNAISFTGLQNFIDESGSTQTIDSTGRFATTVNHNRVLFTAANGTFVRDLPTHGAMRSAGLPQPRIGGSGNTGVTGPALPGNTHAMYTAVFVRKYADGYELVSPPAYACECTNTSGTGTNAQIQVSYVTTGTSGYLVAGDIVQIYRTKTQAYNQSTQTYTNTGSDYLLVGQHTLTSADITATGFTFVDSIPDVALGEALYTNAGVKTQDGIALPSPTAKIICTFKGYTFYLNRKDPPKFTLRAPVWWSDMGNGATGMDSGTRANGIGDRDVRGNTTIGSPTLSSVAAVDLVGVVIGQQVSQTLQAFPRGTKITAVGASTVTFNANATLNTTGGTVSVCDVIEVNGVLTRIPSSANVQDIQNDNVSTNSFLCISCLNFIIPQVGTAALLPSAVPAQNVDVFYERLSDQLGSITVRATNGTNYVPQLPRLELNETAQTFVSTNVPNGITWSEQNQPENCPPLNTAFVGSGEIYAAYATRDALWIFASDGLWRLSGTGGSAGAEGFDWRIDPVDSTLIIAGPQAGCVLRDMAFAYTNRGLVQISSDGTIRELTLGRLDDRLPGPPWSTPAYSATSAVFLIADETNDEIWMKEPITPGSRVWIYNYINDAFTNDFVGNTTLSGNAPLHGCYSRFLQSVVFLESTFNSLKAPNNSGTRKALDFKLQPLLGDDPFTSRMWQQCDASFYVPDHNYNSQSFTLYANGDTVAPFSNTTGFNCGFRTLVSTSAQKTDAKFGRVSWSVPRNAPAISYTFAPEFFGGGSSVCYFQGIAVKFIDLTEQRADR